MSAELWPCSTCGAPGVLNLGTMGHCTTHASEFLRSLDPAVWQLCGRWIQTGCLRPDHGPGYAECECPACGAGAVQIVGSPCAYCEVSRERLLDWRRETVLRPPELDPSDRIREARLRAWAERLAVAVKAEIITDDEARAAWRREVSNDRRESLDEDYINSLLNDPQFGGGAVHGLNTNSKIRKPSSRDQLIDMAQGLYRIGRTEDERVFLVPDHGPNIALMSGAAKADLARHFLAIEGTSVGRTPLDEAWLTIEGLAHEVPKAALPLRVATTDAGELVIDLGDTSGRAIVVSADGWRIVNRSPVTFRRSKAMLPLPEPVRGGDVSELFTLLAVADRSRDLFAAWLTSALFEGLPHPAPVFRGEQGAAKSTTARVVSRLLDPCMADTSKPPKTDDDWSHTCSARWVVAVDNVSAVPEWWSDALCRTVTGDGWLRRKLYEDDDIVVTKWRRCVILNGISLGAALRPDLAERLVFFDLERPARYLTEAEVNVLADDMAPRVLGGLLDRAAATLAAYPLTEPARDLRMADFGHLLAAHDAGCGTNALEAYRAEVANAFDEALAGDPLATAVIGFMDGQDAWTGTAAELLSKLEIFRPSHEDAFWPKTAHHLSQTMTRSSASLRRVGIVWTKPAPSGGGGPRMAKLTRVSRDAGDASALFVVSDSQRGERGQPEGQAQQGEKERHQADQRHETPNTGGLF